MDYSVIDAQILNTPAAREYRFFRGAWDLHREHVPLPILPEGLTWSDLEPCWHGPPQDPDTIPAGQYVEGHRRTVKGPWPYRRPELCHRWNEPAATLRLGDHEIRVCAGCGLDLTP